MGILSVISSIVRPVTNLIDELHTSEEEKLAVKQALKEMEFGVTTQLYDLELKTIEAKSSIIIAEAKSESWITRSWRPMVMLMFAFLIFNEYFLSMVFGWPTKAIPPDMWDLLKVGMGGYVIGRSVKHGIREWRNPQVSQNEEGLV